MVKYKNAELINWMVEKAKTATSRRNAILNNFERSRPTIRIGSLYFFRYDPKWKHKLLIYDRFPLVFPIEPYSDGFLGLNLHFLTNSEREYLLSKLLKYKNNDKMDETTKLQISYQLLSSTKSLNSLSRPCIKRYLADHVLSKFVEVTANEWDKAIQLPTEDFVRKQ